MSARSTRHLRLISALPDWSDHASDTGPRIIGVLPGEGIGPEIVAASLDVLDIVDQASPRRYEIRRSGKFGRKAAAAAGGGLTAEVADFCASIYAANGAILCGPAAGRFVYDLRKEFDLYCKFTPIQPVRALRNVGPIKAEIVRSADLVVVRENVAGLYFGESFPGEGAGQSVHHRFGYEESQVRRILTAALRLAERRNGRLCVVLKPGGLPAISALWEGVLRDLTQSSPIQASILAIDQAIHQMIAHPDRFDVVAAPNAFGDILSDGASLLLGSRGMSFSGNFGAAGHAVFQAAHDPAPNLAGTGQANPLGQILALAMMLREHFGEAAFAATIEEAIEETLAEGWRTADIAEPGCRVVGTREMGQCVRRNLERLLADGPTPA